MCNNKIALTLMLSLSLAGLALNEAYELDEVNAFADKFDIHYLYDQGELENFRNAVLELNLNVDKPNEQGFCVIHLAAMKGQIKWLALLYSLGANLEIPGGAWQWPPIAWALYKQQTLAFHMLRNFGIRPVQPSFGTTTICLARF